MKKAFVLVCCCCALLTALSACGRRGPLEPPPSMSSQEARQPGLFGPGETDKSGVQGPEAPDRPFILDPLI